MSITKRASDTSTPEARPPAETADWRRAYARRLAITDVLVIAWAVIGTEIVLSDPSGQGATVLGLDEPIVVRTTLLSLLLIVGWQIALALQGTRDHRVVGSGSEEYRRIADAALRLFGAVAIIALLLKVDVARGYLLISFPLGLLALLFTRWLWRQWLTSQRQRGDYSSRVLLVGTPFAIATVGQQLLEQSASGYQLAGVWVPNDDAVPALEARGVPVFSEGTTPLEAMAAIGADTVAVVNADVLGPNGISELSWNLEPNKQHLILAPSLTDIGGPRLHTRPVAGLPLIHIETPRYEGATRFTKRAFDVVTTTLILVALAPLLIALALIVRLTSPGPVLFTQQRIGLNGTPFTMLKFRSMVVDAEDRLTDLLDAQSAGNAVMFKMKHDPRITPIGRAMRRFSLDELPQLLNVLGGTMSLVGPRPPLPREVDRYETRVHRRFLVKPGITGLWQVSGRSNLTWDQSVRLDLTYVENWSLVGDLHILWRTFKAVLARDGAY